MKKNLVYFLVPFVGLIVFGAFYWRFDKEYAIKEQHEKDVIREKKKEKLEQEQRARDKAYQDALKEQDRRKKEKEAKEAKEKQDQDYRQSLYEARRKADREQNKLREQSERLQKDVETEKQAIAKLEDQKKQSLEEEKFLKTYVEKAKANEKSLHQVIDKIVAADEAWAKAEAEAAKAKAKNS